LGIEPQGRAFAVSTPLCSVHDLTEVKALAAVDSLSSLEFAFDTRSADRLEASSTYRVEGPVAILPMREICVGR
jgi:hypothetical protein